MTENADAVSERGPVAEDRVVDLMAALEESINAVRAARESAPVVLDPSVTAPWQQVKCGDCGREYQCTPSDDHYLRAGAPEGAPRVCMACLIGGPT